jgi:hypothetical protein
MSLSHIADPLRGVSQPLLHQRHLGRVQLEKGPQRHRPERGERAGEDEARRCLCFITAEGGLRRRGGGDHVTVCELAAQEFERRFDANEDLDGGPAGGPVVAAAGRA